MAGLKSREKQVKYIIISRDNLRRHYLCKLYLQFNAVIKLKQATFSSAALIMVGDVRRLAFKVPFY
jgi:hypothetical protein